MIIKSFKTYVKKICMVGESHCLDHTSNQLSTAEQLSLLQEENGHLVMMGLFDCVDDTVLVRKALLSVSCNYVII